MKKNLILTILFASFFAGWAEAQTLHAPQTSMHSIAATPEETQATEQHQVVFTFSEGSLKNNIENLAKQFGWSHTVWQPQQDYRWVGQTEIAAANLTDLLTKVLENYPLQAVFYEGNHVLVIIPRNIR